MGRATGQIAFHAASCGASGCLLMSVGTRGGGDSMVALTIAAVHF